MAVALLALLLAIGGTGYASQLRGGDSPVAASKAKKLACVSAVSLCRTLRGAVDREIAAYITAHRGRLVGPTGGRGPAGASGGAGAAGAAGAQGGAGAAGAAGVPGVGISWIFGNGVDGSQTISASTTLTRDMYYADLTVNPGVTLNTGGFRIFVSGTLTLGAGSLIGRDGLDATASGPPAGLTPGSLGGSGPGANMGLCLVVAQSTRWVEWAEREPVARVVLLPRLRPASADRRHLTPRWPRSRVGRSTERSFPVDPEEVAAAARPATAAVAAAVCALPRDR